ncbi:unnamed protein product [Rhizophagus irregularis]|uniref:Uncharacterized protein n=1 Tax=Rhizophagus irregularis TaxID=588596 RepID=A0A915ZFS2_9GLOM|nr:unnamed protein product [Rhizophagus irregularis]CAB5169276.1 unnamed protein product [Rhizophagus irregularis]CAB5375359.1 unnamed protein product [Rhizophagus irregularis]
MTHYNKITSNAPIFRWASNEYGELQIAAEIIACDCSRKQSITITRYLGDNNDPINRYDLSTPNGRHNALGL